MITLGRNQFRDVVIKVEDKKSNRVVNEFVLIEDKYNYKLNTRFVSEGKSSITLSDFNICLLLSNCPSNQLSLFLKCFVFKCDYYRRNLGNKNSDQIRKRLVVSKGSHFDEMSPLTAKDIRRNILHKSSKENIKDSKISDESPKSSKNGSKFKRKSDEIDDKDRLNKRKPINSLIPSPVRGLRLLNDNNLTDEQRRVISAVLSGRSVFFTGSAGTGKSHLLKYIVQRLPPETTYVTASTGIAASHIGGITLHMFSGLTPDLSRKGAEECAKDILSKNFKANKWRKCKCLVIDEISMVCGKYFGLLENVAKIVRNCDKPFGGIQLVVCGDFLQLPPITKRGEDKCFTFQSQAWSQTIGLSFQLTQVMRQTDKQFIKLLQSIRIGKCDESVQRQIIDTIKNDFSGRDLCPTRLFTHRSDVDALNEKEMTELEGQSVVFEAHDSDRKFTVILDNMCPTARKLELKVGAQVMLNRNIDVSRGLVNGLNGKVVGFEKEKSNLFHPRIRFINGCETVIKPENWTIKVADSKQIIRRHLPLQLSWGLSIHKSQGMTIDNGLEISLARVFESGQAYVALSRCKTLKNLRIIDFNQNCFIVDSNALQFYESNDFF